MIGDGTICLPRSIIIGLNQFQKRCSTPVELFDVDCVELDNQWLCIVHWLKQDCSEKPYLFTENLIFTLKETK